MKLREQFSLFLFLLVFQVGIIQDLFHILDLFMDFIIALFEFVVKIFAYILGFFRALLDIVIRSGS